MGLLTRIVAEMVVEVRELCNPAGCTGLAGHIGFADHTALVVRTVSAASKVPVPVSMMTATVAGQPACSIVVAAAATVEKSQCS